MRSIRMFAACRQLPSEQDILTQIQTEALSKNTKKKTFSFEFKTKHRKIDTLIKLIECSSKPTT